MAPPRPRIPAPVADVLDDVAEEHDYNSMGEAMRHVCREAEYDV